MPSQCQILLYFIKSICRIDNWRIFQAIHRALLQRRKDFRPGHWSSDCSHRIKGCHMDFVFHRTDFQTVQISRHFNFMFTIADVTESVLPEPKSNHALVVQFFQDILANITIQDLISS